MAVNVYSTSVTTDNISRYAIIMRFLPINVTNMPLNILHKTNQTEVKMVLEIDNEKILLHKCFDVLELCTYH